MKLSGDMLNTNKNQGHLTQCTAQVKLSVLQDTLGAKNLHAFKEIMGESPSTNVTLKT